MAIILSGCSDFVGTLSAETLNYDSFRLSTPMLKYIDFYRMDRMGKVPVFDMLDTNSRLIRDCSPQNYPTPDACTHSTRYINICGAIKQCKIPDQMMSCSSFSVSDLISNIFTNIYASSQLYLEELIYEALIGSVEADITGEDGKVTTKTLDMATDIGAGNIIDASAGFTYDKVKEAYTALSRSNYRGKIVFFVPQKAFLDLQKEAFDKGNAFCCLLEKGMNVEVEAPFGSRAVFIAPLDNRVFQTVGGKVRGFAFIDRAVAMAYTSKTTLNMTCCDGDIPITPSEVNGFVAGIIRTNPSTQFGGLLVQYMVMAGAARLKPKAVVAIDFDPSILS